MGHPEEQQKPPALRFSIRIAGSVTSISLRRNIVALWLTLTDSAQENAIEKVSDFVYKCLDDWSNTNGKGLSDYITERMIEDILEDDDFESYRSILLCI